MGTGWALWALRSACFCMLIGGFFEAGDRLRAMAESCVFGVWRAVQRTERLHASLRPPSYLWFLDHRMALICFQFVCMPLRPPNRIWIYIPTYRLPALLLPHLITIT
jgi:hypothetical protein